MIPSFESGGNLPPGIHPATWSELASRFGGTAHRQSLLAGLKGALEALREAGCRRVYIDGSFVTAKVEPGDFDGCWEVDMITNERQYLITKAEVRRFEQALAKTAERNKNLHPALRKAAREGLESQLQELREQLEEYEALRAGTQTTFVFDSLTSLPEGLIKARIARGLTQKQLAESLNLQEQQIQRYEATLYEGAALERIEAVAKVLGIRETVKFDLSMPPRIAKEQA